MRSPVQCAKILDAFESKKILSLAILILFLAMFFLIITLALAANGGLDFGLPIITPNDSFDELGEKLRPEQIENLYLYTYNNKIENKSLRIVAAHDSSVYSKSQADFICDGIDDQNEINEAFTSLPAEGGIVVLSEGSFTCSGDVFPKMYSSLHGQGKDTRIQFNSNNGHLRIEREYVTLENFHISGENYSNPYIGVVVIRVGHVNLKNITGYCDSSTQGVFFIYSFGELIEYFKNIEDIELVNCKVVDAGTYGWIFSANDNSAYRTIKNVRLTDCQAINCGRYSRYDPWVTGYDLAERCNIDGMVVTRCLAEGSWESGFHFEYPPTKSNVSMIDCVSRNNAQKMFSGGQEPAYGAGFVLSGDVYLENCTSEKNSVGYLCSYGGIILQRCTDNHSQNAIKIFDISTGLKVDSCKIVGSPYPVIISEGDSHSVLLDNLIIVSYEKDSYLTAAILVKKDVHNPSEILIRDSIIRGYRIGIYNQALKEVKVSGVSVLGSDIDLINCEQLT